jgi:hypothetical protein
MTKEGCRPITLPQQRAAITSLGLPARFSNRLDYNEQARRRFVMELTARIHIEGGATGQTFQSYRVALPPVTLRMSFSSPCMRA